MRISKPRSTSSPDCHEELGSPSIKAEGPMLTWTQDASVATGCRSIPWLYFLAFWVPIAFVALALLQHWVEPKTLFADPAETFGAHPLTGVVGTFCDTVWFASG